MTHAKRALAACLLLVGIAAPTLPHAGATWCVADGGAPPIPDCCKSTVRQTITVDERTVFYIDVREKPEAGLVWIYEEANGLGGLQRGGTTQWGDLLDRTDPCYDLLPGYPHDTPLV